jgi:DNA repair protein RecN (Recombination protein N)
VVEGRLRLAGRTAAAVAERVVDAGAEPDDDGTVVLSRTVTAEGRSRAHIGGRTVPVSVLGEVGEQVVAVHGQSDQLRLLRPGEQRAALDRFAGPDHDKLLAELRERHTQWRVVEDDLADRRRNARERNQEADLLRLGLDEITRVDPQPGEDEGLREEAQRLEHAEGLRAAAQVAHQAVAGSAESGDEAPDAIGLLGLARRTLEAQSTVDRLLGELAVRLE